MSNRSRKQPKQQNGFVIRELRLKSLGPGARYYLGYCGSTSLGFGSVSVFIYLVTLQILHDLGTYLCFRSFRSSSAAASFVFYQACW